MEELSAADIERFLDPNTFATLRQTNSSTSVTDTDTDAEIGESNPIASTMAESVALLRSAYSRLETVLSNLATIKNESEAAAELSDDTARDEAYGKLRSLTAGIDIIAENSRFSGERVLDGSTITLANSSGGSSQELTLQNFFTHGDNGLGLTEQTKTAVVTQFFSDGTTMLNSNSNLVGVSILGAEYAEPTSGEELDDGDYRIRIRYNGDQSIVELTDTTFEVKSSATVDLTGDGEVEIDFDNGVKLTLETVSSLTSLYDHTTLGEEQYYADLNFIKIYRHDLAVLDQAETVTTAGLTTQRTTTSEDGSGTLTVSAASYDESLVDTGEESIAAGEYSIRVNYLDDNSNVWLRDSGGRLLKLITDVDLSGTASQEVDFGNGLKVTVDATNMGSTPDSVEATVTVTETTAGSVVGPTLGTTTGDSSSTGTLAISAMGNGTVTTDDDLLANGDYTLEVTYLGANSTAAIKDSDGTIVDFKASLDLSADGSTTVDMGNGVTFTVDNTSFGDGSGSVTASFKMEKQVASVNTDGVSSAAEATFNSTNTLTDTDGNTLEVTAAAAGTVTDEDGELSSGDYTVEITYMGEYSMASLIDSNGDRIKFLGQIDLSSAGTTTLDFTNGLTVDIENTGGYSDLFEKFTASVSYKQERTGTSANFDFADYANQAQAAIEVVQEQMTIVDDTFFQINQVKAAQDFFVEQARNSSSIAGRGAVSLLSGVVSSSVSNIFQPSASTAALANNIQLILNAAQNGQTTNFTIADAISTAANTTTGGLSTLITAANA